MTQKMIKLKNLWHINLDTFLSDAKNWWANECWHKDFDKLTRLQKIIISSDLEIMKIYLEHIILNQVKI